MKDGKRVQIIGIVEGTGPKEEDKELLQDDIIKELFSKKL